MAKFEHNFILINNKNQMYNDVDSLERQFQQIQKMLDDDLEFVKLHWYAETQEWK